MIKRSLRLALAICCMSAQAHALPLIRDAEIEHTLRSYANPIFTVAGLKPQAVRIFIVNRDDLNAFVAGGSNMFLHAGLIMASDDPAMLIGVMAHETGHIAGGHLARGTENLKNAQIGTVLSYVLGAAAAAASGKPEIGAAVITGGGTSLQRNFLAHNRAHEEAADQAALQYLDDLNISSSGLYQMFAKLQRRERMLAGRIDPYLLTHPLSQSRIEHVRGHMNRSDIPEGKYPSRLTLMHERMVAKLYSFLKSPEKTFQKYPKSQSNVPARLAHAVAYYKIPDLKRSLEKIDSLIKEYPSDPFFHELKGQILFENRKPQDALAAYRKAVSLKSDSALILTETARVELSLDQAELTRQAADRLRKANAIDNSNPSTWRLLATAYGKMGDKGQSALALAEEALLISDIDIARQQAERAQQQLAKHSPGWLRAEDIKIRVSQLQQEKDGFDPLPF